MANKPGSKYYPLFRHLQSQGADRVRLSFDEIERLLADPLPPSAHNSPAFWSNRAEGGYQAAAWLEAGYYVTGLDRAAGEVTFRRVRLNYDAAGSGGEVRWGPEMIRDLRIRLGINQSELAEMVGVRQQTVSEWENDIYRPTQTRAKLLRRVAERAGFEFKTSGDDPGS
ncbi:MAG: helix-turn-helix transcriptional regulator [Anaerolineales bacterium]